MVAPSLNNFVALGLPCSQATSSVESLQYQQVLVAILDANPFLSDGSKTVRQVVHDASFCS